MEKAGSSSTLRRISGSKSVAHQELQPDRSGGLRNSPIAAVVLTNGDIDHVAGLLSLRERQPFSVYATARVQSVLRENSVFRILAPDVVAGLRCR